MPRLLTFLALAGTAAACTPPAAPIAPEPQAVVLEVESAPDWLAPGAELEVRDEHDLVLLKVALTERPPLLVDFDAPLSVKHLAVRVHDDAHEAQGEADVSGGYAHCKVD